jgi:hypothetical protein
MKGWNLPNKAAPVAEVIEKEQTENHDDKLFAKDW